MKINVVLPSRGLVFAACEQALSENLEGFDAKVFRSGTLKIPAMKIPDSHNFLTQEALKDNPDYILFVEDDTVMPEGALQRLIDADSDIACIDYGVQGFGCITRDKYTNEILWCGLGCTLVKSKVFATLQMPYFRSDIQLLLNNYPQEEWIQAPRDAYGGQDIYFCTMARKQGTKIVQVEGECVHLQLDSLGRKEINNGIHAISQKPTISKYQTVPL